VAVLLLPHHWHRGPCRVHDAVEASIHDSPEIFRAHLLERCKLPITGIVDQSYVNWGVNNPEQRRVLAQLQVSGMLSKESIEAGSAPFVEMQNMIHDAIDRHTLRVDVAMELISKMLGSWAEVTMGLILLKPGMAKKYRDGGFAIDWAGIVRK
jgi:hypothetical protein